MAKFTVHAEGNIVQLWVDGVCFITSVINTEQAIALAYRTAGALGLVKQPDKAPAIIVEDRTT